MADYAEWVHRAEKFVRDFDRLPGQWETTVSVGPALAESEADRLHDTLPFGLPAPLRDFYVTGSASCECKYHWMPSEPYVSQLGEVFPGQQDVYGGASIIPACKLEETHEVHSWFDPDTGTEEQEGRQLRLWVAEQISELLGDGADRIFDKDEYVSGENARPSPEAVRLWRETVPFVRVANGDYLALQVGSGQDNWPVVYMCHDDTEDPVKLISPSFERFMSDWQQLCYVGPEIWLLIAFLDDDGHGLLRADQPTARRWREIIGAERD